jgi:2-oxoglutarate dehydrogenase E2 component (dihydrolipoamide succinyltransferase)
MVASVQTSTHVQSFIEVDVTNIVKWREKNKNTFEKREGEIDLHLFSWKQLPKR